MPRLALYLHTERGESPPQPVSAGHGAPILTLAIAKLSARTLALDGEVAVHDQQLRSRFDWLRELDPTPSPRLPVCMSFDILYKDGRDLSALRLRDRRARLEDVVGGSELVSLGDGRARRPGGVDAGNRARVRGSGGEGRDQRVRDRPHDTVAEGVTARKRDGEAGRQRALRQAGSFTPKPPAFSAPRPASQQQAHGFLNGREGVDSRGTRHLLWIRCPS